MSEAVKWGVVLALTAAIVAIGIIWRVTKGPGRRPVSPGTAIRYRGQALGRVLEIDQGARIAHISYTVDGSTHELDVPFTYEKRTVAENAASTSMGDFAMPTGWKAYQTTSLGRIYPGASIGVRYDLADPSRAVAVPNSHSPLG